jgi:hypothetical protein
MRVPNLDAAVVSQSKILDYLLQPSHPVGGPKARFFLRFGFLRERWFELANAIVDHARQNDVTLVERSEYGTRYVVDGPLQSPSGTALNVRAAWYIDRDGTTPRFVTAHPLPKL